MDVCTYRGHDKQKKADRVSGSKITKKADVTYDLNMPLLDSNCLLIVRMSDVSLMLRNWVVWLVDSLPHD